MGWKNKHAANKYIKNNEMKSWHDIKHLTCWTFIGFTLMMPLPLLLMLLLLMMLIFLIRTRMEQLRSSFVCVYDRNSLAVAQQRVGWRKKQKPNNFILYSVCRIFFVFVAFVYFCLFFRVCSFQFQRRTRDFCFNLLLFLSSNLHRCFIHSTPKLEWTWTIVLFVYCKWRNIYNKKTRTAKEKTVPMKCELKENKIDGQRERNSNKVCTIFLLHIYFFVVSKWETFAF